MVKVSIAESTTTIDVELLAEIINCVEIREPFDLWSSLRESANALDDWLGDYPPLVRSNLQVELACATTNRDIGRTWQLVFGDAPTKEVPLHATMYEARTTSAAIVYLHSTQSVAVSMLPDLDTEDVLPAPIAYNVMRIGKTALIPYHRPGDPAVGDATRGLAGRCSSVLLSNHGPVI